MYTYILYTRTLFLLQVCKKVAVRSETYCKDQHATEAMPNQHNAIIFTVFVLLQLFNQINARKLHGEGTQFTCFTATKAQILTQKVVRSERV